MISDYLSALQSNLKPTLKKYRYVFLIFCTIISPNSFAKFISTANSFYELHDQIEYFSETSPTDNFSITQAINHKNWKISDNPIPNFGFQERAYWFKIDLEYIDLSKKDWLLEVRAPLLDNIDVYYVKNNKPFTRFGTGDSKSFDNRPIAHRNFLFPINLRNAEKITIYFRISSIKGAIFFPLYLWEANTFYLSELDTLLIYGCFYGLMMVLVLYNLFIFISTRELSYLYYVACMLCGLLISANLQGLDYQYLWPTWVDWQQKSSTTLGALVITVGLLFTVEFLNLKQTLPRYYHIILIIVGISFIDSISSTLDLGNPFFTTILGIIGASLAMLLGIMAQINGNQSARFYNYAWFGLLLGGSGLAFAHLGLIPFNIYTEHGVMIGFSAQGLFFSFALADRINRLQSEQIQLRNNAENSQKNIEQIIGALPNLLVITDQQLHIKQVNKYLLNRLNYTEVDLLGHPLHKLFFELNSNTSINQLFSKNLSSAIETTYQTKEGIGLTVLFSYAPLNDGYICTAQDLTELKNIEKERNIAQDRLIQAQRVKTIGTLAGGIAHDMNNILTPVVGCTDLVLQNIASDDPNRVLLEQVMKASERAKDLVKQILNFSRPSEEDQKPLKLQTVITDALELVRAVVPNTIQINTQIGNEYPLIEANYGQIHQIIINLCTNASHAMINRSGHINVILKNCEFTSIQQLNHIILPEGKYLKLTVEDNGSGMDAQIQAKIFDPFFTTKEQGEGTGLGLSIVSSIISHHNGYIDLESELAKGTAFHIYFPVKTNLKENTEETKKTAVEMGKEHILFVDDEEAIAFMMQHMLEQLGYKITAFTSSQSALENFQADINKYDLIITDQTMPVVSGTEMLQHMQALKKDLRGIIITGSGGNQAKQFCKNKGNNFIVLNKPILLPELSANVRELLDIN